MLVVILRSSKLVSLSFCMADPIDEDEPYMFALCCSSFFQNFSCITSSSKDAILLRRVEVVLASSFLASVCVPLSFFSLPIIASFSASRSYTCSSSLLMISADSLLICVSVCTSLAASSSMLLLTSISFFAPSSSFFSLLFSSTIFWMLVISSFKQFCSWAICVLLTTNSCSILASQELRCFS